ncbi:MAG TPA: hypothetical protein DD735_00215, partial [Clostridiales bacterium]|nr:hypothetical protein [Clostridiales bacterium]
MIQHFPILSIMVLFLGAFLVVLVGRSRIARTAVVSAAVLTSFALMVALIKPVMIDGQIISYWMGNWAPVSGYAIGIGIEVDALSLFFGLLVSLAVMLSGF